MSSLSHEQLSMYMFPNEIKAKGVQRGESHIGEMPEEVWDRKYTEAHDWDYHGLHDVSHDLASDIRANGVKKPVSIGLNHGKLSDGYHRVAVASVHRPNDLLPVEYEKYSN